MSAISKYPGPTKRNGKQETSIDDVINPSGISIFRGYEERVATQAVQVQSAAPMSCDQLDELPTQESIEQIIIGSSLPADVKDKASSTFRDELVSELDKGDQANIKTIKDQLDWMKAMFPDISEPLRQFIKNYTGVSKAVRALSNQLLD